jgi:hypothetical protein
MTRLPIYKLADGSTRRLSDEDAKRYEAKPVDTKAKTPANKARIPATKTADD